MTLAEHLESDEAARRRIREALGSTLFVEAGAGTGKTRALVDRFVALIRAGHPVERLVAITFTEKAAAELRDRVRGELEALLVEEEEPKLRAAIESLDRAQISTIHAFAHGLLRSFAVDAGIDPAFEVQDEVAAERRFEERWRTYLEELAGDSAAETAVSRALALGLTTVNLATLARTFWYQTGVAEELSLQPLAEAATPVWPDLTGLRQELVDTGYERVRIDDKLREPIERTVGFIETLIAVGEDEREAFLASGATVLREGFSNGRQANWGGSHEIDQARKTARSVVDELSMLLGGLREQVLAELLGIVVRFVVADATLRCRDGRLVFDDLILRLRDILRDSPFARIDMRQRFDALLIDEFQDTDPLQVDIALSFATDDYGAIEPGRLFLVGDPKQSIYRFRRADMAIYERTRSHLEGEGNEAPVLALNRRSRAVVLEWVNTVFGGLIGAGDNPAVQPPYRPIHPEREGVLNGPGVAWFGDEVPDTARQARRVEAGQVVAWCRQALLDGWEVQDRDGSVRRARYRDIAVLVPARTVLQPLEQAFTAAGIPYRVEGGSLVYGTQEVRDLINCLTAIDDPTDEVAVVGALRSPAYACSDVELAEHRLVAGGSFNYLAPSLDDAAETRAEGRPSTGSGRTASTGRVAEALRSLRAWHQERHTRSLAALVERFVADRWLVEAGIYDSGSRNPFRRARFVIEQARAFEASRPESLRAFVAWLERRAGEAILDHEGAGLDDDEDAVRILTVHGAKGLEFPIVFVAGLGAAPSNQTSVLGIDRANGDIAVSIGAKTRNTQFTLGPQAAVAANEKLHQVAERDRLLYVAATRARDHLVLSLFYAAKTRDSASQRLIAAGACEGAVALEMLPVVTGGWAPLEGLEVAPVTQTRDEFEEQRATVVANARSRIFTSATALGRAAEAADAEEKQERDDETEPWARGRAGTHRGRAVHAALQTVAWDADDATIAAIAKAQAVAEAIPDAADDVAALIRQALTTGAASRARSATRALREVPFAAPVQDAIVEGFVDLLIETPDGIELVDWKTDRVPAGSVEERLREYELQAGLYVLGIEAATNRPVTRLTYVFLDPQREASPGEPAKLREAARARLAGTV